jgi:hypothetical protein
LPRSYVFSLQEFLFADHFIELDKIVLWIGSGSSIASESGFEYGSRVLVIKNWKKIELNIFLLSKMTIYLSLGVLKRRHSYKEKPSALKREHLALQKIKFILLFSISVGHFCPPGSGSGCESGSGSTTLHETK